MTTNTTPLFAWREEYATHHPEIDQQHKRLVGYLNDLHNGMISGNSNQQLTKLLANLVQYTQTHFRAEEKLMTQHGYPGYRMHHQTHEDLERQVAEFQNQLRGGRITLSVDLLRFLKSWLQHHIQGADKEFGRFLASKNAI
jgi:hemerythrin-like metal-binding protein